jgi:hypothetical protein
MHKSCSIDDSTGRYKSGVFQYFSSVRTVGTFHEYLIQHSLNQEIPKTILGG